MPFAFALFFVCTGYGMDGWNCNWDISWSTLESTQSFLGCDMAICICVECVIQAANNTVSGLSRFPTDLGMLNGLPFRERTAEAGVAKRYLFGL